MVGSAQSDIGYAPTIGFHWRGLVGATLSMSSGGEFSFINQAGTNYSPLRIGNLFVTGITYFANGTTYYVNASGVAKFNTATATTFTGALSGNATTASALIGSYTANGGQQSPNYFGVNRVGALMMNTTINGNS